MTKRRKFVVNGFAATGSKWAEPLIETEKKRFKKEGAKIASKKYREKKKAEKEITEKMEFQEAIKGKGFALDNLRYDDGEVLKPSNENIIIEDETEFFERNLKIL